MPLAMTSRHLHLDVEDDTGYGVGDSKGMSMIKLLVGLVLWGLVGCTGSHKAEPKMNRAQAIAHGEDLLVKKYGEQVSKQKPFYANYSDGIWMVGGTQSPCAVASEACQSGAGSVSFSDADGQVLTINHTK